MTWLARIFGITFLLAVFLLLSVLPFLFINYKLVFIIAAFIYYPAWMYGIYLLFRHMQKSIREAVIKIVVDETGIHFKKRDGSTDEILYNKLERWNLSDEYDISLSTKNKTWLLKVRYGGSTVKVDFQKMDSGLSYYVGNTEALRRRFIQGMVYFRPDLSIDPFIFNVFNINPENFKFDRKTYAIEILKIVLILILAGSALGLLMLGLIN